MAWHVIGRTDLKRFLLFATVAASAGFLYWSTASAIDTYSAGDPANGIGNSRHNLGGVGHYTVTSNTSEICVFCHTPHHTNTNDRLKPLWNRGTQAPVAFTAYGTTLGGTSVINTDIGSTTLACLSCHDGVTTFDNLVNAPGKGAAAAGVDQNWTFSKGFGNVGSPIDTMNGALRRNLGTDLSNDHPVSIAYNASVAGLRPTNTVIASINLTADLADSAATFDNGNLTKNLWAVKGYVSNSATIADLLRDGKVECSSCHDPHFNNKSWNEVDSTYAADSSAEFWSNGNFLRRVGGNSGSGVCRTCHNK